jgi:hypothetical protein
MSQMVESRGWARFQQRLEAAPMSGARWLLVLKRHGYHSSNEYSELSRLCRALGDPFVNVY